jgi:hypothetical protein
MGVRYAKMIKSSTRYVKKKSYKIFDESVFLEQIRNTSWWDVYQATDTNEAVHVFTNKINFILDQMAPIKTFQTTSKYCPWLTEETKLLIKKRNTAQNENFEVFKKLRNNVTKSLKKKRKLSGRNKN